MDKKPADFSDKQTNMDTRSKIAFFQSMDKATQVLKRYMFTFKLKLVLKELYECLNLYYFYEKYFTWKWVNKILYLSFLDLSVANVSEFNRIHIHAQCVYWSTGISYRTPEHAHWLTHFCWGLLIVTTEKGKRWKYHIQMLVNWLLFSNGYILWQQRMYFYVWLWYKEKEHQTTRQSRVSMLFLLLVT
jgi:hypothetical protein